MVQLSIRCHPSVPVEAGELEEWLEQQVDGLRADAPHATVRLARLVQRVPSGEFDIGWLLEVELPDAAGPAAERRLSNLVTDMRLLGFHPTLLAPVDAPVRPLAASGNGR
jgi:hypothetical protein